MKRWVTNSHWLKLGGLTALMVGVQLLTAGTANAVPAFARQTHQPCTTCHSVHFPTLNSFGRNFKANGYTMMMGGQDTVEGSGLSLPVTLNAAMVGSLQYVKDNGNEMGIPSALSMYLGGRIGEKSGFLMEMPFGNQAVEGTDSNGDMVDGETVGAVPSLGSIKWNYVEDVKGVNVGLHAYSTSMAGPSYGYELLSTGAMGMNVPMPGANAMGAIGLHMEHGATLMSKFMENMSGSMMMAGKATGFGVSAQQNDWYVYYSPYVATQKVEHIGEPDLANYLRAVWTPTFSGFNIGLGTQLYFGNGTANGMTMDAKATTVDFQAQGQVAGRPIGIFASWAKAPKSSSSTENWYNMSTGGDNSAFGLLVESEVMDRLSVNVGFVKATYWMDMMSMSMSTEGTATSVGASYLLAPNKLLMVRALNFGGDLNDKMGTVTLRMGF